MKSVVLEDTEKQLKSELELPWKSVAEGEQQIIGRCGHGEVTVPVGGSVP